MNDTQFTIFLAALIGLDNPEMTVTEAVTKAQAFERGAKLALIELKQNTQISQEDVKGMLEDDEN